MEQTTVADFARQLYQQFGTRALVIAAQQRRSAESKGDDKNLAAWRRIEAALHEARGPAAS